MKRSKQELKAELMVIPFHIFPVIEELFTAETRQEPRRMLLAG